MDADVRQSRRWRDVVLPWATSVAVHALIVLAAGLMLRTLVAIARPAEQSQNELPEMEMLSPEMPAGMSDAYLGHNEYGEFPPTQDVTPDVTADTGFAERPGEAFDVEDTSRDAGAASPRFLGAQALEPGGNLNADGPTGGGRGGPAARFGPSSGGGVPDGSIFRPGKPVASVAYVCDASGSMIDKFALLREQLGRSVGGLKSVQSFNVIFFRDERAAALTESVLMTGVPENRRRAQRFMDDVVPSGTTDPLPALELAFRQKPELIYLLTDGDFPNNEAVVEFIRRRNAGGKVRVNTIALVERGDGYEQVLKQIAAENGGTFTHYAGE